MKLLSYIYISFAVLLSVYAQTIEKAKDFERNSLELKKKLIEAKKSFKFKEPESTNDSAADITDSILTVKDHDEKPSGSAFYASLWGVPVVITNVNVITAVNNPLIQDPKGNSYKLKSMLAFSEDDIAIFELESPGLLPPLELGYNLSSFSVNTKIQAYGNDSEKSIITPIDGTIKDIKKNKIDISSKITPGYNGGALVCENKVIGLLTYPLKCNPDNSNLQGTLMEGKNIYLEKYCGSPQCFGIRLDSINPDEAEVLDPLSSVNDLKIIRELREANNKALSHKIQFIDLLLEKKKDAKIIKSAWALVHMNKALRKSIEECYNQLSIPPEKFSCSNKVLQKLFSEELAIYRRNCCMWDFEELFTSQNPDFMKKLISVTANMKRHFQLPPKCKTCNGKGYRMVEIDNPKYATNNMAFAFKTVYLKCEECNGTGKVMVSRYNYVLKNKKYADIICKPLKINFAGFVPGTDKFNALPETRKMLFLQKITSDINNTYIYRKSPRFRFSKSVVLNFVLGKLQEIRIYFPYSKEMYQYMKNSLEKKYGKFTWETEDKCTFGRIDAPDYRISIGWGYTVSEKFKLQNILYVSCKHRELTKAKTAFNRLRYKFSKVKDFRLKNAPKPENTSGF
jgi:hypothetical protein